jgi:hypothetical protein
MPSLCKYCKRDLEREGCFTYISVGGGEVAHPYCYEKNNPPHLASDIRAVLGGGTDPVLSREVILDHLSPAQWESIVQDFNRLLQERYEQRLARYAIEEREKAGHV